MKVDFKRNKINSNKVKILDKTSKNKRQNGITLIALVITIIVLLILAGVSIAMLTGQNGILTQAQNASTQTEIAEAKEKAQMDIMAWQSERLENGQDATLNDETIKTILTGKDYVKELKDTSFISTKGDHEIQYSELYTTGNNQGGTANAGEEVTKPSTWPESNEIKAISDGAGNTIPLPIDFYYVGGTKTEGVVISDAPNDDMDNTAEGNQFVWVPVDNYDDFQRQVGYASGNLNVTTWPSDYGEADSTGVNQYLADNSMQETDTTKQEAMAMYESVKDYGGFYIGRFEAGQEDGNLVVKKGKAVYNNVPWSANGSNMQETAGTTGGAVELSRNFDSRYANQSVTSTLCYGVQWDATMNFIDPNYITKATIGTPACSEDSYVRDSTGQGNYLDDDSTNNPGNTGAKEEYKIKNIYDLAGNVFEWTMESCDTFLRVVRGGNYTDSGSEDPSSIRDLNSPDNTIPRIGFRVTLYL